jgi:hypothetical protein
LKKNVWKKKKEKEEEDHVELVQQTSMYTPAEK